MKRENGGLSSYKRKSEKWPTPIRDRLFSSECKEEANKGKKGKKGKKVYLLPFCPSCLFASNSSFVLKPIPSPSRTRRVLAIHRVRSGRFSASAPVGPGRRR